MATKTTVALAGCIVCDEGGILLLHRNTPQRVQWEIPGGGIDPGEDAQAAAIREMQEELGVQVRVTQKLGARQFTQDDTDLHYTWFLAEITHGTPMLAEPHLYDKFGYLSFVTLGRRYDELSVGAQQFMEELAYGRITLLGI